MTPPGPRSRACGLRLLVAALFLFPLTAGEEGWRDDLRAAVAEAGRPGHERPLVLLFSTEGCRWCERLLEDSAADPTARRALAEVVGVRVLAERNRALTAALAIQAFPTLVLVNRKGAVVKLVRGYLPPADFATTLRVLVLHGDQEQGEALRLAEPGELEPESALAALGGEDPERRRAARQVLAEATALRPRLWPLLTDPRLAVRLDAAAVLAAQLGGEVDYDPLAPGPERAAQAESWRARIEGATGAVP